MNSKKRKLAYIREKNYYRKGGEGAYHFKATPIMLNDTESLMSILKQQIDRLSTRFNLNFAIIPSSVHAGLPGDDKEMNTIRYKYGVYNENNGKEK